MQIVSTKGHVHDYFLYEKCGDGLYAKEAIGYSYLDGVVLSHNLEAIENYFSEAAFIALPLGVRQDDLTNAHLTQWARKALQPAIGFTEWLHYALLCREPIRL